MNHRRIAQLRLLARNISFWRAVADHEGRDAQLALCALNDIEALNEIADILEVEHRLRERKKEAERTSKYDPSGKAA